MKRLLVAVLVLAGCASKAPQERPLPPGMVTVATFTAEADPVAGTFTIRTQATDAGRARGMAGLASATVQVENDGAPWFDSPVTHGCPDGTRTWGANVKVTSLLGPDIWLGGVYAEITDFAGAAGSEGCNSDEAPEGLDAEHGLWEYPTIGPLPEDARTVTWAFGRVSNLGVTFSGRIVAAKMGVTDVFTQVMEGIQVVADNGDGMVFASSDFDRLQFVDFDGNDAGVSALMNGRATSIAPVVDDGVIWVTTEYNEVGIVTSDGLSAAFAYAGSGSLGGIVTDPTNPDRAWFRSNTGMFIRTVDRSGSVPTVGPIVSTPYAPWGMAIGPEGHLYVTAPVGNRILVYTTGESGGALLEDFATGPGCAGPTSIIQGPGGKMWFSARDSNAVCSFTTGADVAPVNTAEVPMQLAVGPDDEVWVAATPNAGTITQSSQVARMDETGPGYRITLINTVGAFGLARGGGKLWAVDFYGIYPIELDGDL